MPTNRAFLYEFLGEKTKMVDSVRAVSPGKIQFNLPKNTHPGLYRIVVGPNNFCDIIFNNEDIKLRTHYATPLDSLKVIESKENTLLISYMSFFMNLNRKGQEISRLMGLYDKNSDLYKSLEKEMMNLRKQDPQKVVKEIILQHPDTYVARFLQVEQTPVVPLGLSPKDELEYVIDHFFDEINFNDSSLIYSPPLISKVQTYFSMINRAYQPAEIEEKMMKGLDRLMSMAAISDPVFEFLLNNLADRYENSEYETFFAYLTETYLLEAGCTDDERALELSEALASIKKTTIGIRAPEIILPLSQGPLILSEIPEKYVLVFFWASWCPGCKEMLPEIKNIYKNFHASGFEIVAISLDKEKAAYNAALQKGQYPWINYSELKGWDCSITYDYGIRATPTMVLLDENRNIIAKPRSPGMLAEILSQVRF